jgi:hypothetical protein
MKKIKRAMAMALTAAMMLGMFAMAASATENEGQTSTNPEQNTEQNPTNTDNSGNSSSSGSSGKSVTQTVQDSVDPITGLDVTKAVQVTAGVALPNEKFYIEMVPAEVEDGTVVGQSKDADGNLKGGTDVVSGPALANPVLEFDFGATDNTATGGTSQTKTFDITKFAGEGITKPGVYRYEIFEVNKNTNGTYSQVVDPNADKTGDDVKTYYVENDYTTYVVDLYVNTSGNDLAVTSVSVNTKGSDVKPDSITFTNKINCANITITKKVVGDLYSPDESFDFYILIPVEGDTITLTASDTIQAQKVNASGENEGEVQELSVGGQTIDAIAATEGNKFSLKNGESLKITAPVSMIYKIVEADYSGEGYETKVTYTSLGTANKKDPADGQELKETDGEKNYVGIRGTTESNVNTVLFTNERHNSKPDTGINLDFAPYVLVLALVIVAGGALLVYKKKRTVR